MPSADTGNEDEFDPIPVMGSKNSSQGKDRVVFKAAFMQGQEEGQRMGLWALSHTLR